jgi:uncharacterized cupredoxin-like copper-binding protein
MNDSRTNAGGLEMDQARGAVGKRVLLSFAVLLLPTTAGVAANWSRAATLTVIASEYRFTPNALTFRRGVAYRLHLENRGKELHEFTAPEFFKSVALRNPGVLNPDRTEVDLPPGSVRDVYLVPRRAGHYRLFCADHDWAGMIGEIAVE